MTKSELAEKLKGELETAEWSWLKPHADRGALILVSNELDLVEAAVAVGSNDLKVVEQWMKSQLVKKPAPEQFEAWEKTPTQQFSFLIIQPWVLIQSKAH